MSVDVLDVVIVGAGLSGLMAAQQLQEAGLQVVVLDKARGVGGRMATRRIEQGVFDHGAQYFTARDPRFAAFVDQWHDEGVIQRWSRGFVDMHHYWDNNGDPRYRGTQGMTAVPKHLAQPLTVHLQMRVVSAIKHDDHWVVTTENGQTYPCRALILTAPVPQSLALLNDLPPQLYQVLDAITYNPCIAVMVLLDGPSGLPRPGGMWPGREPISWIADNHQKGISSSYAVTIHARPEFTREYWDSPNEKVVEALVEAADDLIGANVVTYQVQRWRYSQPTTVYPEPCVVMVEPPPLVFAGDAFAGPRVEGAALSGLAAAERLLAILTEAKP